jgi:hypothetical protein
LGDGGEIVLRRQPCAKIAYCSRRLCASRRPEHAEPVRININVGAAAAFGGVNPARHTCHQRFAINVLTRRTPMKIFAIASAKSPLTPEQLQKYMPKEVPATLKHYLDGDVEQFWFREKAGPIFLMNADSVEQAKAKLDTLPLVAAGLMSYEFIPVTPLSPLRLLIQGK